MFGSILVLASSVARAASKYHLLLRDPHFSVIAVLVSSTVNQGGTLKDYFAAENTRIFSNQEGIIKIVLNSENCCGAANFFASIVSVEVEILSRIHS